MQASDLPSLSVRRPTLVVVINLLIVIAGLAALIGVSDPLKPNAKAAIDALHTAGLATALITGDSRATGAAIAKQLGIDHVEAEVLPEDKLTALQALRTRHGTVAFGTEGHFMQRIGMETVVFGAGSIDQAHQPNEYLAKDQIDPGPFDPTFVQSRRSDVELDRSD